MKNPDGIILRKIAKLAILFTPFRDFYENSARYPVCLVGAPVKSELLVR